MAKEKGPIDIAESAGKRYAEDFYKPLRRSMREDWAIRPLFGKKMTPNERRDLAATFVRNPATVLALHLKSLNEAKDRPPGHVPKDFWAGLDRHFKLLKGEEEE